MGDNDVRADRADSDERTQDQNPAFVHRAFSSIADRYVLTNHVLSLGIDVAWRRRVADLVAGVQPEMVLDVATGSGDLAATVAKRNPSARVVGVDFCAPMLAQARKRGLDDLLVSDGLALPFPDDTFDALTIGYGLRNMADWSAALHEFSRVLRPGGRLVILDFSLPTVKPVRKIYRIYLHRILPRIAGFLTGNREAYDYLGESIERFPAGGEMVQLIESAGFISASSEKLCGGISSLYSAKNGANTALSSGSTGLGK